MPDEQQRKSEEIDALAVDGHLLDQAAAGNQEAIRQMARIAFEHVLRMASQYDPSIDGVTPFLVDALRAMAEGKSPNEAFKWNAKRGRQPENLAMLKWYMAKCVEDLILRHNMSEKKAIELVSEASHRGKSEGGTVWKAWHNYIRGQRTPPSDIFPLPKSIVATMRKLDRRLEGIIREQGGTK